MENVYVKGIVLRNFRGIGDETQYISPFSRFNFFIGENNSGKSCVLEYLFKYHASHLKQKLKIDQMDIHRGKSQEDFFAATAVNKEEIKELILEELSLKSSSFTQADIRELNKLIDLLSINDSVIVTFNNNEVSTWNEHLPPKESRLLDPAHIQRVWSMLTNLSHGEYTRDWIPGLCKHIGSKVKPDFPQVMLVPAIREISVSRSDARPYDGSGLIDILNQLQNPDVNEIESEAKFQSINGFLKTVLDSPTAKIKVPHTRDKLLVEINNKTLPLSHLGTGIQEVILIAAYSTMFDNQIVCIEEPEIHLHPILQRRLIQYLQEKTNNQYFIATHSASLIDSVDSSVFHVKNVAGSTYITNALSHEDRHKICDELGYRASDLLQSNFIIWVEGPSDRIYINHWISSVASELREGIEYSIMFYGGRLLSHLHSEQLDADDTDTEMLISLRRINQNLCVVIDSDKSSAAKAINATKERIKAELESVDCLAWITDGREIENYVPEALMTEALENAYPNKFKGRIAVGQFKHVLPFTQQDGSAFKEVDKVKIAKLICESPADLDVLDLKVMIDKLVSKIKAANRHY